MRICSTAEKLRVVSEGEVLVMFVTVDGEYTARNISEWHKILQRNGDWSLHLFNRIFHGKYELFCCYTLHKYTSGG